MGKSRAAAAVAIMLTLASCATSVPPAPSPPAAFTIPIFYATNRNDTGAATLIERFGAEPSALSYGRVEIGIPADHRIGTIETTSSWNIVASDADESDFAIGPVTSLAPSALLTALDAEVAKTGYAPILVFIHGFNNGFEGTLRRTAQLAADLDWRGAVLAYAWPSRQAMFQFGADRSNAEASAAPLRIFLQMLANRRSGGPIDIVAHSMGSRVLLLALAGMPQPQRPFDEIVLAAPEISREEFMALAPRTIASARRVTLYASDGDLPLMLAAQLFGTPSAGDANGGPLLTPGIDSIDASAVSGDMLGHSYYGDSRAVLADLHQLLNNGLGPAQRFGLRPRDVGEGRYWELKP